MINFSSLRSIAIPEGVVIRVESNGKILWVKHEDIDYFNYVSLGDSIAAGQGIRNEEHLTVSELYDKWQYGYEGLTSTEIISGNYTDLLRTKLRGIYGDNSVSTISFARSGDTVADLLKKLSHENVVEKIKEANLVTICIGANDILGSVGDHIDSYISSGDLSGLESDVSHNLSVLNTDSDSNSYISLLNRLTEINPNAEYIFTTVYNPYKYLYLEEGSNGFFAPLLNMIPNTSSVIGFDVAPTIRDGLLSTSAVQMLFSRVNILSGWVEEYVGRLDQIIKNKVGRHASSGYNFKVADTKALYDGVPDRPVSAPYHYNDLVNVDYTRGYTVPMMDWGRLWEGTSVTDVTSYWLALILKHVNVSSFSIDLEGLATELVNDLINKVIIPCIDPHPRTYGQNMLHRSFANAIGLDSIKEYSITFNANGGSNIVDDQIIYGVDNLTAYSNINPNVFSPPSEGYYFVNWNTKADGSGTAYSDGQLIGLTSDVTLYAQWSNMYTVAWKKRTTDSDCQGLILESSQTGPVSKNGSEYHLRVTLGGSVIQGLGDAIGTSFETSVRSTQVPYGTELYIQLINTGSYDRGAVYLNGNKVVGNSEYCYYTMPIKHDTALIFNWEHEIGSLQDLFEIQDYWIAEVTEYPKATTSSTLALDSGVLDTSVIE